MFRRSPTRPWSERKDPKARPLPGRGPVACRVREDSRSLAWQLPRKRKWPQLLASGRRPLPVDELDDIMWAIAFVNNRGMDDGFPRPTARDHGSAAASRARLSFGSRARFRDDCTLHDRRGL